MPNVGSSIISFATEMVLSTVAVSVIAVLAGGAAEVRWLILVDAESGTLSPSLTGTGRCAAPRLAT